VVDRPLVALVIVSMALVLWIAYVTGRGHAETYCERVAAEAQERGS
jgi:hypothetical protein